MTNEEFQEWKSHPITKEIMKKLKDHRDQCQDRVMDILEGSQDDVFPYLKRLGGIISGLDMILEVEFEYLEGL